MAPTVPATLYLERNNYMIDIKYHCEIKSTDTFDLSKTKQRSYTPNKVDKILVSF